MSKEYSENWEKTFKYEPSFQLGDLVAVKEGANFWFGIIDEINKNPPHTYDRNFCIKISFFDISSGYNLYSWESKDNIYLIKRNIINELEEKYGK